jgi:hypothetical protein
MTWLGDELLSAGDSVNGNWTLTYDDFGRLSTASCSVSGCTPATFNYKYDRFGNRWQQNLTSGSGPSPQYLFNSSNRPVGFSYDSAGNVLNDGYHNYTYDAEDGANITDQATAYKAFRAELLKSFELQSERFEFCSEVTAKARRHGCKIHEVPITYKARTISEGKKIRPRDGFQMG